MASLLDEGTARRAAARSSRWTGMYRNRHIREQSLRADIIRHRRRDKYA